MALFGRFPLAASDFSRRLAGALLWAGAGLAVGYALRFLAIEPESIGRACAALEAPSWCVPRRAAIAFFHLHVIGGVAAAAGALALLGGRRDRWRGWAARLRARPVALVLGGLGMTLYDAGLGSVAVVLGLLAAMDES